MFKHSALLLVDLQNDFCPGGALAVTDGDSVIPVANRLIDLYQQHHGLIIASQDWHPSQHGSFADNQGMPPFSQGELNGLPQTWWPAHCIQKTPGADFHPKLNLAAIQEIIQKGCDPQVDSYSAFFDNGYRHETGLRSLLKARGITHLTILGLATDYCVKFTTIDALALGFTVTLVIDGCRGVNIDPQDSQRTLEDLQKRGATLQSSAAILANPSERT